MKTFTFETTEAVYYGTFYGVQTFEVQAENRPNAWDEVRKLTGLALLLKPETKAQGVQGGTA